MALFSYLRVPLSIPFMASLIGSGGGCIHQFLLNILPSHPLHLSIYLPLPLPQNLSPYHEILSLPLPIPCHLCPPQSPLSIYLNLPITHNIFPTHAPLSFPLDIPHHLHPPRSPLSIFLSLHLPKPSCLSQRFPCCNSYPNMVKVI